METLKGIFQCPQKLTNVIQTSQNSPWLSLRSLNKWYGVFAPQYYKFSHSGVTIKVSLSVAKFDRFEDLEDQVMDYLVSVTDLKVFGCSIDFLQPATQTYPEDPIWDKLQQSMEHTVVFRDSSAVLPSQNNLKDAPSIMFRLLFMSP